MPSAANVVRFMEYPLFYDILLIPISQAGRQLMESLPPRFARAWTFLPCLRN
jgi:hypothetical protein